MNKKLIDKVDGTAISNRVMKDWTLNLSTQMNDKLCGGGVTTIMLGAIVGDLDRSAVASDLQTDSTTARSDGSFTRVTASLARLQHMTDDLSLFVSARGQGANQNLDTSEKFILGGPTGVRAYPVGEGSGDEGWAGNAELRYDVPGGIKIGDLQLIAFADAGGVRLNRHPWTGSVNTATGRNEYTLAGAGAGFNLKFSKVATLRASWATAINDNPGRSTTNKNANGLARKNTFWVQAIAEF
jgi:hemolysin activation/secretion protein